MCGILAICAYPQNCRRDSANANPFASRGFNPVDATHEQQKNNDDGGIRCTNGSSSEILEHCLRQGVDAIKHRGPDGSDVWVSQDGSVGLAHCRLSINDLSSNGSQPLHSDDGKIHAVVNGEIYDYCRLRDLLEAEYGYAFSSESDSELVVALYKVFGAPGMFEHLRGEFAFVIFDESGGPGRIVAGRDRFGIKPLVWTIDGNRILFASEAKAFLPMGWKPEWDVRGITDCGWLVDDRTVFKGVKKVMPGEWIEVTDDRGVETRTYWNAEYPDKRIPDSRTVDDMVLGVRERLVEAVRQRLRADVPVGVYLSGGIDSSAIAGIVTDLARKENVQIGCEDAARVTCFSIQFAETSGYDETAVADRTAEWLGVKCFKLRMDEENLSQYFADAAYHCEHHHFDLNAVAKFALSKFTRQHGVKVVLTGEGSDEHFCGYPSFATEFLREADMSMPNSTLAENEALREGLFKTANGESGAIWRSQTKNSTRPGFVSEIKETSMPDSLLAWQPPKYIYDKWVHDQYQSNWDSRETLIGAHSKEVRNKMRTKWHPSNSAMYLWNKSIMINVILACLGDRTEMAHSIEGRTPFLDHHLAEYVNGLPPSVKLRHTPPHKVDGIAQPAGSAFEHLTEKWILREAARPYITDELYDRRKVTFWAPAKWPKNGRLHSMFKGLLTRDAVENLGFVNYCAVEKALETAFGEKADAVSFRTVCYVAGWVTISTKLGVKKAVIHESGWI
ncbi:hypothetical protein QQS21_002523 [Conoideocrella luteorostrata]|uniref:Glutamine amidotransferase type-2 domain-containing protein n=1 Tax=Conoideocrella luteorostrata TaxID=1105319 RepID=A0AAJ0CV09_9HYPO|nr:hypothetical protein QQS21_002523 [Conoideocrella luteorostrata]